MRESADNTAELAANLESQGMQKLNNRGRGFVISMEIQDLNVISAGIRERRHMD